MLLSLMMIAGMASFYWAQYYLVVIKYPDYYTQKHGSYQWFSGFSTFGFAATINLFIMVVLGLITLLVGLANAAVISFNNRQKENYWEIMNMKHPAGNISPPRCDDQSESSDSDTDSD